MHKLLVFSALFFSLCTLPQSDSLRYDTMVKKMPFNDYWYNIALIPADTNKQLMKQETFHYLENKYSLKYFYKLGYFTEKYSYFYAMKFNLV